MRCSRRQPAPLADKLATQEPVTLLHKRPYRSIALGHDVMRRIQCTAPTYTDLAAFHKLFGFCRCNYRHEF
jgi:hypothetical protein